MSIVSSNSSISEVPGLNNAVQHLQELALRMKSDEFGFKDNDVSSIDGVIEALHELDQERSRIQQNLEVETIEASILRHRLQFLPDQIKQEIAGAVNSARQSNAAELTRLREKLESINQNIDFLEKKHRELEQDNAVLHPERDKVRQEHEEIIMQLNQRLAEKAGKQIVLNETRDKLRETNQKIVDMEEGILQLKEDLIQERADARMEKKRLKKAVYDTTLKTREQKEANVAKKKEVDELHYKVMDSEAELNKIRKSIRRLETSKSRLEGQERALVAQLNKETKQNQDLRLKGAEISRQIDEEQADYTKKREALEARIQELDQFIEEEESRKAELTEKREGLAETLEGKMKIRRADEKRVKQANSELQSTKALLASKAEEVGRLTQENVDMEEHMIELAETHESIVVTLNKQIDEAREQLSRERKDRMELQGERDIVQKEVEEFKQNTNKYMSEMNKKINEGKNQHDALTKEGQQLQRTIRQDDESIKKLKQDLEKTKTDFANMQERHKKEIESLKPNPLKPDVKSRMKMYLEQRRQPMLQLHPSERQFYCLQSIEAYKKSFVDKEMELEQKQPLFQDLEEVFQQTSSEYDAMKKEIVSKKNMKMGLDDAVKRSKREIEKMTGPQAELEENLKKKRGEVVEQLKHQAKDVSEVETIIYTQGCKLKTAIEENDRFREANDKLERQISSLRTQIEENDAMMKKLLDITASIRETLSSDWNKDHELEKEFAARDEILVQELGKLLSSTEKRENVISSITDKLETELSLLSQFLENVTSGSSKAKNGKEKEKSEDTTVTNELTPDTGRSGGLNPHSPLPPITPRKPGAPDTEAKAT